MRKLKRFALQRKVLLIRTAAILLPMFLMLMLAQTAFAKNTYVITDGDRVFTYTTSATDPRKILGEAGLELDEDDTYTTQEGNGTSEITVRRSQTVTIDYYGEEMEVTAYGETVAELLVRMNLSLEENDTLSWPLSDTTFDGMHLRIDSVVHQEQVYTTTVPYTTSYCYDPSLPQGMEQTVVNPQDLIREPQIVFNYNVDKSFREWTTGAPTDECVICTVDTAQSALDLVAAGIGIAFIPDSCIQEREDIRFIPIQNWHQALYMCIYYDKWLEPPVWEFVELLVSAIRESHSKALDFTD